MKIGDAVTWTTAKIEKFGVIVAQIAGNVNMLSALESIPYKYRPDTGPWVTRLTESFLVFAGSRDKKGKLRTEAYWPDTRRLKLLDVKIPFLEDDMVKIAMIEAALTDSKRKTLNNTK